MAGKTVTGNGCTHRDTIAVMGGKFIGGVSADGGDELDVDIVLDDEPRTVQIPPSVELDEVRHGGHT